MTSETYDVTIVGAGPSGLSAASVLSEYPLKILLIDENGQTGGQLWRKPVFKPIKKPKIRDRLKAQITVGTTNGYDGQNLRVITPACVLGVFPENYLLLSTADAGVKEIKSHKIIFSTGAREKVRPFKGWTLPGVMTTGAAQILLKTYGILPAPEMLLAGGGPLLYLFASQALNAQGKVMAVLDRTAMLSVFKSIGVIAQQLPKLGQGLVAMGRLLKERVPLKYQTQVIEAKGKNTLEEIIAAKIASDGTILKGSHKRYRTQKLICGNGFIPNIELPQLAGCDLTYDLDKGGWIVNVDSSMETSIRGIFATGEITGIGGGDKAFIEGKLAALSILNQFGRLKTKRNSRQQAKLLKKRLHYLNFGKFLNRQWATSPREWDQIHDDTIICRCEDITLGTIRGWIKKGFNVVHDLKKATRCGMGTCQGRTCGPMIYDIIGSYNGSDKHFPKHLTVRTPVKPVFLGDLIK